MSYFTSDNFMIHPLSVSGPKCYWCFGTYDLDDSPYGPICGHCRKQCEHCGEYSVADCFEGEYCEGCADMLEVTQ